jgi:phosphatidylethanolamine/phosphatidyl-N-methylethanolamine N-methyltransferase
LPWQSFAGPVGGRLIDTIAGCLRPDGVYTQFTYSWTRWAPPARRQHSALTAAFHHVQVSPNIWRNLPPALVYTCTGPRPAAADRTSPPRTQPVPAREPDPRWTAEKGADPGPARV